MARKGVNICPLITRVLLLNTAVTTRIALKALLTENMAATTSATSSTSQRIGNTAIKRSTTESSATEGGTMNMSRIRTLTQSTGSTVTKKLTVLTSI